MITNVFQSLSEYKEIIFGFILIIIVVTYINRNKIIMSNILRKVYKEEYDNFDEVKHKEYIKSGSFNSIQEDSKLQTYTPTKVSELVTFCDEKREECIQY
jgi:hypothetical protein